VENKVQSSKVQSSKAQSSKVQSSKVQSSKGFSQTVVIISIGILAKLLFRHNIEFAGVRKSFDI
jgi:hypothetical protein